MKIVINSAYSFFSLSRKAINELADRGLHVDEHGTMRDEVRSGQGGLIFISDIARNDPRLVEVVELLGPEADGYGDLEVIEIPDDVKDWYITDYDGKETIREGRFWE